MDSSSAHGENYWQIPPPLSPLLLICNVAKTRPAKQRTTTTHHTGQRTPPLTAAKSSPARPPSSLAPSRPRPPRPAGQRLGTPPGRPRRAGGAHLAPRRAAAPGAGALCPPSESRQVRASCRPLGCRPRRRRAPAGRRCKVAAGTVRNLLQPLRAAQAPGASTARGHIHLAPGKTVAVVARARRTPQRPTFCYASTAISANCQEP